MRTGRSAELSPDPGKPTVNLSERYSDIGKRLKSAKVWEGENWVHSCIIHIDIRCGKVWLQWNSTEDDIAVDLVHAGVLKEDIVLGFQSPFMRQFTEHARG